MATGKRNRAIRETDLYDPIARLFTEQGYTVRGEVKDCDLVGVKDGELVVVELKRNFTVHLLAQAADRQRMTDSVYVALPRPQESPYSKRWKRIQHLLRRLEVGLIFVSFTTVEPRVQIVFHPTPFTRVKPKKKRRALLQEVAERSGDYNQGGSTGRKLMTAYREHAIRIACYLEALGPCSPKRLRELGASPKTGPILYNNVYEWFERVDRGVYGLKASGREALAGYEDLAEQFRRDLAAQEEGDTA